MQKKVLDNAGVVRDAMLLQQPARYSCGAGRWIEKLRITEKIGISSKVVKSYLDSVYKRIKSEQSAQTGPLVRKARG